MTTLPETTAPICLSNATLDDLPEQVARPTYDRNSLTPGIVHVGLGNFHRAHQAWYLHRLMQQGLCHDWALIGAGVRAGDATMREKLLAQDCLTTLIELDPASASVEVIGPMIDFLPVEEDNVALIGCISNPEIRIVAMTVTEGGYFIAPEAGGLDLNDPDIRHDIAHPDTPRTVFGAIVAALKARRDVGNDPFTVLSCDNLQGNGDITRATVVSLARQSDTALAEWIDANSAFPNSMVDCIVPATGPQEMALARDVGIEDAAPVTHENFRQWVIEDRFCAGRPDWDKVGATFTDNVHPFESMKIRLLNAGHQVLANAGELLSIDTIAGCMVDPQVSGLFAKVLHDEIAPHVSAVPDMTPAQYIDLISKRFANAKIHDTTRRVAFDGLSRHRGFLHPVIEDALAQGRSVEGLALVEALWARMCAGTREDGSTIEPNDPAWDTLQETAQHAREAPEAWLTHYGPRLQETDFREPFEAALKKLWEIGTRETLTAYLR